MSRAPLSRPLVLASSSPYRRELLARLRLPFTVASPGIDEAALPGEAPAATAERLSVAKARAVAAQHRGAIVIGSDQVAELDGQPMGKPGTHGAAGAQLRALSGRTAVFHSGVAVLDAVTGRHASACIRTDVTFRTLGEAAIEAYLRADTPYDCAGAAKIESLGIGLVEVVRSDDPTALIGLPLIALTAMLDAAGVPLPWR